MNYRNTTAVALLIAFGLDAASRESRVFAQPSAKADVIKKNVVIVEIRPTAVVGARVIRLGDIATITGGDAGIRDRLKNLDLDDVLEPGESITILPPQIEFRLRIAGLDTNRIFIRGQGSQVTSSPTASTRASDDTNGIGAKASDSTQGRPHRTVDFITDSPDEGPLEREIVRAARECVLRKLPWPEEDVSVRLAQSISSEVRGIQSADGYRFSAELRSAGPAIGRVQVRVVAEAPKRPAIDLSFTLDVRHFDDVVLAKKAIERGKVIASEDLYVDRQDVTEMPDYCSTSVGLVGASARRSIRALVPVKSNDVEVVANVENSVVIKRGEQVKMSVNLGALNVSAMGEVLQEGRLGETIRLRNIESKVIVKGKVISAGEVEVAY